MTRRKMKMLCKISQVDKVDCRLESNPIIYSSLSSKVQTSSSPSSDSGNWGGSVTVLLLPQGYIASRVLSRGACFILKMDLQNTPPLNNLQRYIYEKQVTLGHSWVFSILKPGNTGIYGEMKRVREKIILSCLTINRILNLLKLLKCFNFYYYFLRAGANLGLISTT